MSVGRFWHAEFLFHVEYYVLFLQEIEYVAMSFSPARTDLALKLLSEVLISMRRMAVCFKKGGWRPPDTCVRHRPCLVVGIFQTPQASDPVQLMGNFFSLGSRVCTQAITLLSFGIIQTCPLSPVAYPPSAVMA